MKPTQSHRMLFMSLRTVAAGLAAPILAAALLFGPRTAWAAPHFSTGLNEAAESVESQEAVEPAEAAEAVEDQEPAEAVEAAETPEAVEAPETPEAPEAPEAPESPEAPEGSGG